jgi:hypothetical protein
MLDCISKLHHHHPEGRIQAKPTVLLMSEYEIVAREKPILSVSPCMFRNHPFRFILLWMIVVFAIITFVDAERVSKILPFEKTDAASAAEWLPVAAALVGGFSLFSLFTWWIESITTRLNLMQTFCVLSKGLISRHTSEMGYRNVQNTYVKQGVIQRLLGVGSVGISSSGQSNVEMIIHGVRDPVHIQTRIREIVDR